MISAGRLQDEGYTRAAGCLVGMAVGNAVASLAVKLDFGEIGGSLKHMAELADERLPNLRYPSAIAAEAVIVAQSIARTGSVDPFDICLHLKDGLENYDVPDVEAQTMNVLEKVAAGEDWEHAAMEVQAKDPGSASAGPLSRSISVALFHQSPGTILIEDSRLVSRITHPHAECQWSCAFASLIIVELLAGIAPLQAVDGSLGVCGHRGDIPQQILFRSKEAASTGTEYPDYGAGALETLACSIWALAHHSSFEESLLSTLRPDGDIEPAGALTGAFAGAAYGLSSIDETWIQTVDPDGHLADLAVSTINIA